MPSPRTFQSSSHPQLGAIRRVLGGTGSGEQVHSPLSFGLDPGQGREWGGQQPQHLGQVWPSQWAGGGPFHTQGSGGLSAAQGPSRSTAPGHSSPGASGTPTSFHQDSRPPPRHRMVPRSPAVCCPTNKQPSEERGGRRWPVWGAGRLPGARGLSEAAGVRPLSMAPGPAVTRTAWA